MLMSLHRMGMCDPNPVEFSLSHLSYSLAHISWYRKTKLARVVLLGNGLPWPQWYSTHWPLPSPLPMPCHGLESWTVAGVSRRQSSPKRRLSLQYPNATLFIPTLVSMDFNYSGSGSPMNTSFCPYWLGGCLTYMNAINKYWTSGKIDRWMDEDWVMS